MVTASRIIAGAVIALWAIGLVAFVALGGDDDGGNKVAVPTQPPVTSTTLVPATTTTAPPATTTLPPSTTTSGPQPTVIVDPTQPPTTAPPPTQPPPTQPPPTTQAPTTAPTTEPPPTTTTTTPPPTTTTSPQQAITARIEARIGPSNRGVPPDERVVVQYTPGSTLEVTWAINNGQGTLPTGEPTCSSPPATTTTTTTTTTPGETTTTTTSTTTTTIPGATTTTLPADEGTRAAARREARQILATLRPDIRSGKLDVTGVQLIGTYTSRAPAPATSTWCRSSTRRRRSTPRSRPINKVFDAPPATEVQCLNPAFD